MKPYRRCVLAVALDWNALEEVGLTGGALEWKADLLYFCLGRPTLGEDTGQLGFGPEQHMLTYPEGKPIWSCLFKYLKSLLSDVRLVLDFI
jgi:hypothetical protein